MNRSVDTLLAMMPIESRVRFQKMVAAENKTTEDVAVSILTEGASTYAPMILAMSERRERLAR